MARSEHSRPWKTIRSVAADDTSVLGALVRRADELGRCEECLEGYLDMPGAGRLRVAAIEDGTVVVVADSAAWSARLRFLAPRLVAHAARALDRTDLERIEIRIRPDPDRAPERLRPDRAAAPAATCGLLPATREFLRCAADAFDEGRLKEALLRLAGPEAAAPPGTAAPPAPEHSPGGRPAPRPPGNRC